MKTALHVKLDSDHRIMGQEIVNQDLLKVVGKDHIAPVIRVFNPLNKPENRR